MNTTQFNKFFNTALALLYECMIAFRKLERINI